MSIRTHPLTNDGATTADIAALKKEVGDEMTALLLENRTLRHALEPNEVAVPLDEPTR